MRKWYLLTTISLLVLALGLTWIAGCGDSTTTPTSATPTLVPATSATLSTGAGTATLGVTSIAYNANAFSGAGTVTCQTRNDVTPTLSSGSATPLSYVYYFSLANCTYNGALVGGGTATVTLPTSKAANYIYFSSTTTFGAPTSVGNSATIVGFPFYAVVGSVSGTPVPTATATTPAGTATPTASATSTTPTATATATGSVTPTATATPTGNGAINVTVN